MFPLLRCTSPSACRRLLQERKHPGFRTGITGHTQPSCAPNICKSVQHSSLLTSDLEHAIRGILCACETRAGFRTTAGTCPEPGCWEERRGRFSSIRHHCCSNYDPLLEPGGCTRPTCPVERVVVERHPPEGQLHGAAQHPVLQRSCGKQSTANTSALQIPVLLRENSEQNY